jgi:RsiW-degrading membrane proteinase PrsW (M82 family)
VIAAFRWVDRYEPEPPRLLAFAFFWGATVAALISATLNTIGEMVITSGGASGSAGGAFATAVYIAPWVEEAAKGAAILAVFLFRRHEFDGIVDGIVLAGMVGIGFAFTENILYFGRAFLAGSAELGTAGGISAVGLTFLLRGVLSPFAHPLFTVLTGIGFGLAVSARQPLVRWVAPVAGFLAAVMLHATWNRSAGAGLGNFVVSYLVLMVPAFFILVTVATWSRRREGRVVAQRLPSYVHAGWLAPADVTMVASLPVRKQALQWAEAKYGDAGRRALRDFQLAATELAFLRDRAERGHVANDFAMRERQLLGVVAGSRNALAAAPARRP